MIKGISTVRQLTTFIFPLLGQWKDLGRAVLLIVGETNSKLS